jgi:hypothetical protein
VLNSAFAAKDCANENISKPGNKEENQATREKVDQLKRSNIGRPQSRKSHAPETFQELSSVAK